MENYYHGANINDLNQNSQSYSKKMPKQINFGAYLSCIAAELMDRNLYVQRVMIRSTTCLTVPEEVNCGILFELSTTSFKCEVTGIATISNNFALSLAISYIEYEQLNAIKTSIGHLISVIDKSYLNKELWKH
jgi:hypothetical protein